MSISVSGSPVVVSATTRNQKLVGDGKRGTMAATYVSQASCPASCPWKGSGCYAESGRMAMVTRRLNKSDETDVDAIARLEADGIRQLAGDSHLRLHVVGDTTTDTGAAILADAAKEYSAKHGKSVYTYTHGNTLRESWGSISVLASCESLEGVRDGYNRGFASAMVVEHFEQDTPYPIGDGFVGIPCPQQTGKKAGCIDCGICFHADALRAKKRVILFAAHGSGKAKMLPVLNK